MLNLNKKKSSFFLSKVIIYQTEFVGTNQSYSKITKVVFVFFLIGSEKNHKRNVYFFCLSSK